MSKSYVAKTKISFVEDSFYVNTGDILVHDSANNNSLTVYRGGSIVKIMRHTSLKVLSMLKSKFIEEIVQTKAAPAAQAHKLGNLLKTNPGPKPKKKIEAPVTPEHIQEVVAKRKEEIEEPKSAEAPTV